MNLKERCRTETSLTSIIGKSNSDISLYSWWFPVESIIKRAVGSDKNLKLGQFSISAIRQHTHTSTNLRKRITLFGLRALSTARAVLHGLRTIVDHESGGRQGARAMRCRSRS